MTLSESRCHLFSVSGLSRHLQVQLKHYIPASSSTRGSRRHPALEQQRRRKRPRDRAPERGDVTENLRRNQGANGEERETEQGRRGVTFSPTAHLYELILLSMYYSLDGHYSYNNAIEPTVHHHRTKRGANTDILWGVGLQLITLINERGSHKIMW